MEYRKGLPSRGGDPYVYVYSTAEEQNDENAPVGSRLLTYAVLLPHRELAPEWMHAKLTMLDMATPQDEKSYRMSDCGVPGIGYRGFIWYVIYDDPKYAVEAGIDVSDLIATEA